MNLVHSEDHTLVDDYVAQINGAENKNSLYQGCISDITIFIEEREKKARELEAALKIADTYPLI